VSNIMTGDAFPKTITGLDEQINPTAPVFTDVSVNSTYYNALVYLKDAGVVSGYADGSFKPNNTINRAEFTKIIVNATQVNNGMCIENYANVDGTYKDVFSDVLSPKGSEDPIWYLDYVCVAKDQHLVDGYPDGSFKPNQEINFVEASKIIANAFDLGASSTSTPWYKSYVNVLADKKAIPTTITLFDKKITRGEMAEMAYRLQAKNTSLTSKSYADLN
jgi:hypothetical protein